MERDVRPTQEGIDKEIRALEKYLAEELTHTRETIFELKRRRNDMSPIGSLPTDIVCRLFLLTIDSSDARWPFDNDNIATGPLGGSLTLSHVTHAWRKLAQGFPALWTRIHAHMDTSARFLRFVLDNAGQAPLCLEYIHTTSNTPDALKPFLVPTTWKDMELQKKRPRAFNTLHRVLAGAALFRKIKLLQLDPSLALQLLNGVLSQSDVLEDLHIELAILQKRQFEETDPSRLPFPHLSILKAGATHLRKLKLVNCFTAWAPDPEGPLMDPSQLTVIDLSVSKEASLSDVCSVLGKATQLQELCLKLQKRADATAWVRVQAPRIIFPHLQVLELHGPTRELCSLLDQFTIPAQIMKASLSCYADDGPSMPHPGPALIAFENAHSMLPPDSPGNNGQLHPVAINITQSYVTSTMDGMTDARIPHSLRLVFPEQQSTDSPPIPGVSPRFTVETVLRHQQWGTDYAAEAFPLQFLSPSPTFVKGGWSLVNLQSLNVNTEVPAAFWDVVVYLPQLSKIRVEWGQAVYRLVPQLRRSDSQPGNSTVEGERRHPYRMPFPALSALSVIHGTTDVARDVLRALEERRSRAQTIQGAAPLSQAASTAQDTREGVLDMLHFMECTELSELTPDDYADLYKVALEVSYTPWKEYVPPHEELHSLVDDSDNEAEAL